MWHKEFSWKFLKIPKWACYFKENWYLLLKIKFEWKIENWEVWMCGIYNYELDSFPIHEDFFDEIDGTINRSYFFDTI